MASAGWNPGMGSEGAGALARSLAAEFPIRPPLGNHGAMSPADAATPRPGPNALSPGAPLRVLTDRNLGRAIPYGVRIAAAWSWRLCLILLFGATLIWLLGHISFLLIPI